MYSRSVGAPPPPKIEDIAAVVVAQLPAGGTVPPETVQQITADVAANLDLPDLVVLYLNAKA